MIIFTLAFGAIIFFGVRFIVVDGDYQTRGGIGGRFSDFPNIPIVGVSRIDEAFERGEFSYVTSVSLYRSDLGDYIVILSDTQFDTIDNFLSTPTAVLPIIIVYLIAVAFLANVLIAKYITRRIMTPINTLVSGVHEISNGNLTHRINYKSGDEFDAVCSDFNEMAMRLSDMVEQKQADENSRKELIAGISHDLRTPLTSLKMSIEAIRNGIATTPEKQKKYLDILQRKTEDIEYIIKQLFIFSRMDIGEFPLHIETVDIGIELDEIVNGFTDEYRKEGLEIVLAEKVSEAVNIDKVQFKNIVQNILGNSVKYCTSDSPCAEISSKKIDDDNVEIIIKDNGAGVPDEMLLKLFGHVLK